MNKKTIVRLTESELVNMIENILSEGKPVKKEKLNPGDYNPRPTEEGIDRRRPRKRDRESEDWYITTPVEFQEGIDRRRPRKRDYEMEVGEGIDRRRPRKKDYDMEVYGFSPTSVEEESDRRKKPRNKSYVDKDGFGGYTNEESDRRKKPKKSIVTRDGYGGYNESQEMFEGFIDNLKDWWQDRKFRQPKYGSYVGESQEMDEGFIDNLKDWWQDRKFRQPKYGSYVGESQELDENLDDLKRKFWRWVHNREQRDQGFM